MSPSAPKSPCVAAVGMFDGVHAGHCALLGALVREARARGVRSLVLTFSRHPLSLVRPGAPVPPGLSTPETRRRIILEKGVDEVLFLDSIPDYNRLTGEEFLVLLRERFGVVALVVGFNNHFGSDRMDAARAREISGRTGVEIIEGRPLELTDAPAVSSSAIRTLLAEGDVVLAGVLLGRPYALEGEVVHGQALGRTIGFPTANLRPLAEAPAVPAPGVYAVDAEIPELGLRRRAVTNIGSRPTASGESGPVTIETHIPQLDADLYGRRIVLHFLCRLRDERKFPDLGALSAQIRKDIADAEEGGK